LAVRRGWLTPAATVLATLAVAVCAFAAKHHHSADASGIVFTRHDGTTFSIPHAVVRCGLTDEAGARRVIEVGAFDPDHPRGSYFDIQATLADVAAHPTTRFPYTFVTGHLRRAFIFAYDKTDPNVPGGNETSTQEEDAKGTIVFHKARCKPVPRVWLTVHALLGSEFHGVRRLGIDGSFRGHG
jgi:hypothetical protein